MSDGFTLPGFLRNEPKRNLEIWYTLKYSACFPPIYNLPNSYENFTALLGTIDFYESPYHIMQNIERIKEGVLAYA